METDKKPFGLVAVLKLRFCSTLALKRFCKFVRIFKSRPGSWEAQVQTATLCQRQENHSSD